MKKGKNRFSAGRLWQSDPCVFITGSSRSGTELLRDLLNRHDDITIAKESHYFDDFRPRFRSSEIKQPTDALRYRALEYFSRIETGSYAFPGRPDSERYLSFVHQINRLSLSLGRSIDAVFVAFCQLSGQEHHAGAPAKMLWGEKTPRHIYRSRQIFEIFPNSKMIFVLRDPRGVAASYRHWHTVELEGFMALPEQSAAAKAERRRIQNSWSPTISALLWKSAFKTACSLLEEYGTDRVHILKFEDLLHEPEAIIQSLCDFINIEPAESMQNVRVINSTYHRPNSRFGFDASAADRWRYTLSSPEISHLERIAGRAMLKAGYERSSYTGAHLGYSCQQILRAPIDIGRAIFMNRNRIGNIAQYVTSRLISTR